MSARLVMAAPSFGLELTARARTGTDYPLIGLLVAARLLGLLGRRLEPVGLVRGSRRTLALLERVGLGVELLEVRALLAGRDLGLRLLGGLARFGLALLRRLLRTALARAPLLIGGRPLALSASAGLRALLLGLAATGSAAPLGLRLALVGLALARRRRCSADAVLVGGAVGSGGKLERLLDRQADDLQARGDDGAGNGKQVHLVLLGDRFGANCHRYPDGRRPNREARAAHSGGGDHG